MEKLVLINWNDKRATEIKSKIDSIEKTISKQKDMFITDIKKVRVDNSIIIRYSFNPGDHKV